MPDGTGGHRGLHDASCQAVQDKFKLSSSSADAAAHSMPHYKLSIQFLLGYTNIGNVYRSH